MIYLALGVAVVGYFAFKKGLITIPGIAPAVSSVPVASTAIAIPYDQPKGEDISVIAPKLDPTGMSLDFGF